jgi:urease accessory protein
MHLEPFARDYDARAFTIGVSGCVKSGKRALLLALCRLLRDTYSLAIVAGQALPGEDSCREFLVRHKTLASARLAQVQFDSHPYVAIESLMTSFRPELLFVDVARDAAGCDDMAGLADFTIHVVDGSGDGISPNEWLDVAESDLLVINKTQVGPPIDPDLNVVVRDALRLRGDATLVFAQVRHGIGIVPITRHFLSSWRQATAPAVPARQFAAAAAIASV